jgi:hypothetical protein
LVDSGLGGDPPGVGVFGAGGFDDAVFDPVVFDEVVFDAVAFEDGLELGELVAAALMTAGLAAAGVAGGLEPLTDLSPVLGFVSAVGAVGGEVTGGGVQLGASSGIEGAVAGAGTGSSARRDAPRETISTSARPPASALRVARNARTVDASTGRKSIEFGPAISDALRNTSRLGKFTERRHRGDVRRSVGGAQRRRGAHRLN